VNFDFPDELKQLRDEARRFLSERCPTSVPRRILEGPEPYDRALWQSMAEMGWAGAAIPEEFGGAGLGHLAVCVLAEELGHAVAPVPFSSSVYLATEAIQLFGSDAHKRQYLPKLAAGETIGTFAMAERPGPADPDRLTTHVSNGRLTGAKLAVPDGDVADFAVVAVHGGPAPWLHLVDLTGAGVERHAVKTIDPTRSHARLTFDAAPASALPGSEGRESVRQLLDRAAVMLAFEQVGCAQAALEMARDYARERYAFGRPIGSFQAIKHKLAPSNWRAPTRITVPGRCTRTQPNCRSPHRSRASQHAMPAGWRQRRTSRRMAGWASPGRWTVSSTTVAPSCMRWRWAECGSGSAG
jgi:acyl-CoA dehydrogenase